MHKHNCYKIPSQKSKMFIVNAGVVCCVFFFLGNCADGAVPVIIQKKKNWKLIYGRKYEMFYSTKKKIILIVNFDFGDFFYRAMTEAECGKNDTQFVHNEVIIKFFVSTGYLFLRSSMFHSCSSSVRLFFFSLHAGFSCRLFALRWRTLQW